MLTIVTMAAAAAAAVPDAGADRAAVAQLDTHYQAAVKRNDADAMDRILDDDFVLVVGSGTVFTRKDLLDGARSAAVVYEKQDEDPGSQIVRVYGDTAIVTAKLWLKGTATGTPFERKLWFSDTYVRRPGGWRYAFGQASLPLPAESAAQ
jgi:ketosteroid isomerase-like protein